jgi:hypothetical protein
VADTVRDGNVRVTPVFLSLAKTACSDDVSTPETPSRPHVEESFPVTLPLEYLKNWNFCPDGALNRAEASYFVFPGIPAGKTVVWPRSIEVLGADLRWRSLFWNTLAARQMTGD